LLAVGIAYGLVGRADDFDRGNQSIVRTVSAVDLDEWLLVRVMLDHLDRDNHGLGQIDFLGDRDAAMYLSPAESAQSRMQHVSVRLDRALGVLKPDALTRPGIIGLGQALHQDAGEERD